METIEASAALFKVLAHPTRVAILQLLRHGEACVCHLEAVLGVRQAYLSQQLAVLREAGLITGRREGWNVYYDIARPEIFAVLDAVVPLLPAMASEEVTLVSLSPPHCACPKCQAHRAS
jgi:ArsR family transcriptional regulator